MIERDEIQEIMSHKRSEPATPEADDERVVQLSQKARTLASEPPDDPSAS